MFEDTAPLRSASLAQGVRDELIRLITSGALKPGTRLNEVHLAERLGVSRGPVREAARELEGLGMTVSRPRLGFYVADYSDREIVEIYEVSLWIHQALVRDFMIWSDAEACRAILRDVDSISMADMQAFSDSLLAFRQRMLADVHNRYLAEHALSLYRRFYIIGAIVRAEDVAGRMTRIVSTLRAFWTALAERDGARAEEIMRADGEHWLADLPPRFMQRTKADI